MRSTSGTAVGDKACAMCTLEKIDSHKSRSRNHNSRHSHLCVYLEQQNVNADGALEIIWTASFKTGKVKV